jgi:hypothetical protein
MLSTFATLRVNSAKHLDSCRERPFAAAQGDHEGHPIGINLSHEERQEAG